MLTSRAARGRMLAVAGLALVLAATLAWLAVPVRDARDPPPLAADIFGLQHLPAAPEAGTATSPSSPPPLVGEKAAMHNVQAPFVALGPAAQPFHFAGTPADRLRARTCLAAAMFYEAGDDPVGQLAVGQVVLNRVRHPAFPPSVCGVVTQGSDRATGCQFTFTCDGALARRPSGSAQARALAHAGFMLDGMTFAGVGLATHYHTVDVYPWWSPRLEKIARVGAHLFFRWPGYWGSARAVLGRRGGVEPSAALFAQFGGVPDAPGAGTSVLAVPRASELVGAIEDDEPGAPSAHAVKTPTRSDGEPVATIPFARRLPIASHTDEPVPVLGAPVLMGSRLLRMFPEQGVFFLELAPGSTDATRRKIAGLLCGGRSECHVYGWQSAAAAPKSAELDPAARAALAFSFARTPSE